MFSKVNVKLDEKQNQKTFLITTAVTTNIMEAMDEKMKTGKNHNLKVIKQEQQSTYLKKTNEKVWYFLVRKKMADLLHNIKNHWKCGDTSETQTS